MGAHSGERLGGRRGRAPYPSKRSQLGAHYTDPDKIMLIVNAVIKPLGTIECRDALLNENGTEAGWPHRPPVGAPWPIPGM
jgi:hypothetical protein